VNFIEQRLVYYKIYLYFCYNYNYRCFLQHNFSSYENHIDIRFSKKRIFLFNVTY